VAFPANEGTAALPTAPIDESLANDEARFTSTNVSSVQNMARNAIANLACHGEMTTRGNTVIGRRRCAPPLSEPPLRQQRCRHHCHMLQSKPTTELPTSCEASAAMAWNPERPSVSRREGSVTFDALGD